MELHNYRHPWYELYANVGCSGIIYVNGVSVQSFFGKQTEIDKEGIGAFLGGQVPINHVLLQSGKYEVKAVMFPRFGQKKLKGNFDKMMIDFNLSDVDNINPYRWKETKHSFHPKLESPDGKMVPNSDPNAEYGNMLSNPIEGLPSFIIATEIEVELPFVLDGWQNSIDLSKLDKTVLKQKVLEYYRQIHAVLKEHNLVNF